jgi:predicted amidohydrolase
VIKPWNATILQIQPHSIGAVADKAEATAARLKRIDDIEAMISRAVEEGETDFVMLPEFSVAHAEDDLSGVADGDGPEMGRLGGIAQKHGILLAAMLYVTDARFPGRYFNASILFGDTGDVLARYYRIMTNHSSSPHDFWQRYLDVVGMEGAFPVARTKLGNFAMLSSLEMMYPELARIYMLRGAEILLHLSGDRKVDIGVKQTRAAENMMYCLSANAPPGELVPRRNVASAAVDWLGYVLAEGPKPNAGLCRAKIDIEALRTARATPLHDDYVNYLSRMRTEVMRGHYEAVSLYPMDEYVENSTYEAKLAPETAPHGIAIAIEQMRRANIIGGHEPADPVDAEPLVKP